MVDLVSIWIDLLSIWMIGQNSRARSRAALNVLKQKQWRRFSKVESSKIVNKQAKIMSASLKRMPDMGAKNGEDMLEVLADDMGRYGLLTIN